MTDIANTCPECGAHWQGGKTCADHFHQMLEWEFTDPVAGSVHHLTVLCYYIQHPSLLSPEGLAEQQALLRRFIEEGITPVEMRESIRDRVDSGKRDWSLKPKGQPASYDRPMPWPMTVSDAAGESLEGYVERVTAWANAVLATLNETAGA